MEATMLAATVDLPRLGHQGATAPEASEMRCLGEQRARQSSDEVGPLSPLEYEARGPADWGQPCSPGSAATKKTAHAHLLARTLEGGLGPLTVLLRTQSPDSAFSSDSSAASSPTPPLPPQADALRTAMHSSAERKGSSSRTSRGSLHTRKSTSAQSDDWLEPLSQRRASSTSNMKGSTSGHIGPGGRSRNPSPAHNDIVPAQHVPAPSRLRLDEGSPTGSPRSLRMLRASRLSFDMSQGSAWDCSPGSRTEQRLQGQQPELQSIPAKASADRLAKTAGGSAPRLARASRPCPDSATRRGQGVDGSAPSQGRRLSFNEDTSTGGTLNAASQLRHLFGSENELSSLGASPRPGSASPGCQLASDVSTKSPGRGFRPGGLPRSPQASPRRAKPIAAAQASPLSTAAKEMGTLLPSDLKAGLRTPGTPVQESPEQSQPLSPRVMSSDDSRLSSQGCQGLRGSTAGSLRRGFESSKRGVALSGNSIGRRQGSQGRDPWGKGGHGDECVLQLKGDHNAEKRHDLKQVQGMAQEPGAGKELGEDLEKGGRQDMRQIWRGIQLPLHGPRVPRRGARLYQETGGTQAVELGGSAGHREGGVHNGEKDMRPGVAHAEGSSVAASPVVPRRQHRRNASVELHRIRGTPNETSVQPVLRLLVAAAGIDDAQIGSCSSGVPERGPRRLIAHGRHDSESSMMSDLAIEHLNAAKQRDRGAVESVAGYSIARGQDLSRLLQPGQVGQPSLGRNDSGMGVLPAGKLHSVAGLGVRQKSPLSGGSGDFDLGAAAAAARALENKKAHRSRLSMDGGAHGALRAPLRGLRLKDFVLGQPYEDIRKYYVMHKKTLGSGQFGVIRKCKEVTTGSIYACKTIAKKSIQCAEDAEDIRKEVGCLTMLQQHPTVVSLRRTFEDSENIHIVMDLCQGGDLLDRITAKGQLEEEDAARLCQSLIEALLHCHCMGIVHRDIKPENILLTKLDSDSDIKLVDFGVATFVEGGQALTEVIGTPEYMAPEVIRKSYGPSADIWSAGVVMYIALCGLPPFWASSRQSVAEAILNKDVSFKSAKWAKISDECKDVIGRMLHKDPAQRISATEILHHPWILRFAAP